MKFFVCVAAVLGVACAAPAEESVRDKRGIFGEPGGLHSHAHIDHDLLTHTDVLHSHAPVLHAHAPVLHAPLHGHAHVHHSPILHSSIHAAPILHAAPALSAGPLLHAPLRAPVLHAPLHAPTLHSSLHGGLHHHDILDHHLLHHAAGPIISHYPHHDHHDIILPARTSHKSYHHAPIRSW